MRALVLVLALSALAGGQEGKLPKVVRNVERRTAQRMLVWAKDAELAELHGTARRIYERILELDVDHGLARRKLGFRRVKKQWVRDKKVRLEVEARKDADAKLTKQYEETGRLLEEEHLKEVVRVCVKYGSVEEKRRILLPLLERMPRRSDVHEALGHEKIGDRYVRPGLVDLVRVMPMRMRAWRACAERPVTTKPTASTFPVAGVVSLVFRGAAGCEVACTLPDQSEAAAAVVVRTHALLRDLLGKETDPWKPSPLVFMDPAAYTKMLKELHPDKDEFKLYRRFGNYEHRNYYVIRVWSPADAADRYAHNAGYMTMFEAATPAVEGGAQRESRTYPWLLEGFGYFLSFELFGTGFISFVSLTESSAKTKFTRPPPSVKKRAECLQWLHDQMLAKRAYALRDVCARSLNNLDFCASMQAYSFVRFLFLLDPAAAKLLPAALRKQKGGAQVTRTDRALREVFNKGIDDLEPLWCAFVLEVGG